MVGAVAFFEEAECIIGLTVVNARHYVGERFIAQGAGVEERRDEC